MTKHSPEKLFINQKVSVARFTSNEWYPTQIQDLGEQHFYIARPYHQSMPLILYLDEQVQVSFAAQGARYKFITKVTGTREEQVFMYRLALPQTMTRVQLRKNVRIPILLDVEYALYDEKKRPVKFFKTFTRDLSAGGMRLIVPKVLPTGTLICLRFTLGSGKKSKFYELQGRVSVVYPSEVAEVTVESVGIKFIDLTRHQEDAITGFVFTAMAEQNRLR